MPIHFPVELLCRNLSVAVRLVVAGVLLAQGASNGQSFTGKELERRLARVEEGQMLLLKGDELYGAGEYGKASLAYAGARNAFPNAEATSALRQAAARRFALASVEYGRELLRNGDLDAAKAAVDKVFEESNSEDDPDAKAFRAQLDDPIRNNPALTKGHAKDVDEVRRLLYMAQGAFDLGKYIESQDRYEDVLRIDPYNKAARRGMEQATAQRASYLSVARDQARAEALAQVSGAWELPLEVEPVIPVFPDNMGDGESGINEFVPLSNKISRIVIPQFEIVQGSLVEALDLLQLRAAENDRTSIGNEQKGINIAMNLGNAQQSPAKDILAKTFDLKVNNVPVDAILKFIAEITGTTYKVDDFAITISPVGHNSNEMISRTYRVSPDFLSRISAGVNSEAKTDDIFNTEIGKGGLLATRVGAQEALANQGVNFPNGASAIFNSTANTLLVFNTAGNHDIIEQIIESINQTEPVSVAVRVTMLKVEQERLEEMGYDWMLNSFGFGGSSAVAGADKFNLTGGTTGTGTAITDIALPTGAPGGPTNPITSGNRSGDGAFQKVSIDTLIASANTGGRQTSNRAPGVLGVNGVIGSSVVQALMRALDQKKGVDLMSQPSVTTRSGQAASVRFVKEFIYPTQYEPPEVSSARTSTTIGEDGLLRETVEQSTPTVIPATPSEFNTRDVGMILEVLPVADANRHFVNVTLNPSITDFDGFINYGSPINAPVTGLLGQLTTQQISENRILMPVFSVQRVNTNLNMADGATIVIGGLLKEESFSNNDKVPVLGALPVVGRFFKSEARKHQSTAIMILVNVELLDPTGRPYRDR